MIPNWVPRTVGILALVLCVSVAFSGVSAAAGTTLGDHNDGPPAAADGNIDPQNGTGWYEAQVGDGESGFSGQFESQGEGEGSQSGFSINNSNEGAMNIQVSKGQGFLNVNASGDDAGPSGTISVFGGASGNILGNSGGNYGGVTCTFSPDQQGNPCQSE